jgi:hypothetical protein
MDIASRTATADQRSAIFARLNARNRLVRVLRFGLPVIGAIILAGLLLQIYIGSLVPDFGFANITIDRDNLVVEAPTYAGVGTDGTRYTLSAATARAAFGNTDLIDLTGAAFRMTQPGGEVIAADADLAELMVSSQVVTVDGPMRINTASGISGIVGDAVVDIDGESLVAPGGADLAFDDGTTLEAATMTYDGAAGLWSFTGVTLEIAETPGEAEYAAQQVPGPTEPTQP